MTLSADEFLRRFLLHVLEDGAACLRWFEGASQWLDSHESERKGKTHAEHWWPRLAVTFEDLCSHRGSKSAWERARHTYAFFREASEGKSAACALLGYIRTFDSWEDRLSRSVLRSLIMTIQLYIGPLDVPDENDVAGLNAARTEIIVWSRENEGKRPIYWLLERLARHGYSTGNPSEVVNTARGLLRALDKGTPADRYAARAALAYAMPDGDGIPVHFAMGSVLWPHLVPEGRVAPVADYLESLVRLRATQFAFWDCHRYIGNSNVGKYVPRPRTTAPEESGMQGQPEVTPSPAADLAHRPTWTPRGSG